MSVRGAPNPIISAFVRQKCPKEEKIRSRREIVLEAEIRAEGMTISRGQIKTIVLIFWVKLALFLFQIIQHI